MTTVKTLAGILNVLEAEMLRDAITAKENSLALAGLDDPEKALAFIRSNLCISYLFARFTVPSYAAAVFSSLTAFHPADDALGATLSKLADAVRGELFNNNVFGRPGECHAHYHDMREAYEAAGGNMTDLSAFMELEGRLGFDRAIEMSTLWSPKSVRYARGLKRCYEDPLALFILMPANEELAPRIYARALVSLCREPRFAKFRQFIERHVALDEEDHGPIALDWLELYLDKTGRTPERIREAAGKVLAYVNGAEPAS